MASGGATVLDRIRWRMIICLWLPLSLCIGCTPENLATPDPLSSTATEVQRFTAVSTPSRAPMDDEQMQQFLSEDLQGELISFHSNDEEAGEINVRFQILLEGTTARTIRVAREDTVCILHAIERSQLIYQQIVISGWAPITVDINANTQNTELLLLRYDRETVDAIDWNALRTQYIWLIASYSQIHDSLLD